MEQSEVKKIKVVYAGKVLSGNSVGYAYRKLNNSGEITEDYLLFGSKLHKYGAIGIQLTLENPSGSSYRIEKGCEPVLHTDITTIRRLRAESEAIETLMKAKKKLSEGYAFDLTTLKDLRVTYKGMNYTGRQALIANILEYLTR